MEKMKLSERAYFEGMRTIKEKIRNKKVFFVPQAGYEIAKRLSHISLNFRTVFHHSDADIIIDDIIDSGDTLNEYKEKGVEFFALVSKNRKYDKFAAIKMPSNVWVDIFEEENPVKKNITRILQFIGEDPKREGLVDTPDRVMRSYDKLYGGYKMNPKDILKTSFTEKSDEMVLLKDIEFYSTCEHHMIPFYGKIHIAYLPKKKVVGISKLARLVECYARRLQIQERLVNQIADSMMEVIKPKGVMVVAEAQHLCMTARGVEKQNSVMVTSAIRGAFKNTNTRNEFLQLVKK